MWVKYDISISKSFQYDLGTDRFAYDLLTAVHSVIGRTLCNINRAYTILAHILRFATVEYFYLIYNLVCAI
jgi:hypothetical protein